MNKQSRPCRALLSSERDKRGNLPKSALTRELIIISNEARSLAGERLKIRPEGGEKKVGR